jgi:4-amino-4-deoxy-L-arabinose transferase-like glycosyltransferase
MNFSREMNIQNKPWVSWLDKWFPWLLLAGILTNATGLLLPIMEPDGCLYAMISKTMVLSGDYINLKVEGKDWLDKPHFPFWMACLSFKVFGINGFAYKLPAFVFWLMGARYVYCFAKKLYNIPTARLAVLIYLAAEHLIISNNDVRAEPYLTGLIIAATYYYYRVYTDKTWKYVVYGSLLLAAAVMTKGIFIAVFVFSGFFLEWIIKKQWKEFLNPRWWLALLLLIIFIVPELYCLYIQFDLHPEKLVFNQTGASGVRFFFWDSQFGRFLNTGPIKGEGNLFFYTHTLLWAFLPWSPIVIIALISMIRKKKPIVDYSTDFICTGIFLTGFILFSLSKFQLPHYLNILFPFLSVIIAHFLIDTISRSDEKILWYTQNILFVTAFIFCVLLSYLLDLHPVLFISLVLTILAIVLYRLFPGRDLRSIIGRSFCCILVANIFLNGMFYPALFNYQSGMKAAEYLSKNEIQTPVYTLPEPMPEFAFEFYSNQNVGHLTEKDLFTLKKNAFVFAPKILLDTLDQRGFRIKVLKSFPHFHITRLTGKFINIRTRKDEIDSTILATIENPG